MGSGGRYRLDASAVQPLVDGVRELDTNAFVTSTSSEPRCRPASATEGTAYLPARLASRRCRREERVPFGPLRTNSTYSYP